MASSVNDMMAAANRDVPKISPQEVRDRLRSGDALLVDVRDGTEIRDSGKIRGAVNVARGMLEFRADPESPYHDPAFRKDRTVILYCAFGAGRQDAEGFGLPKCLQRRWVQGFGRRGPRSRSEQIEARNEIASRS